MNQLNSLSFDAINTFLVDFGEQIVFNKFGGSSMTILGIVNRNPPSAFLGFAGSEGYKHEVEIANDSTAGVTAISLNKDTVLINNRVNGAMEEFTVMQVLENDQGMWKLAIG